MYVITDKKLNVVIDLGETLDYMENGYPRIVEKNVAFPVEMVDVYEVEDIAEGICPIKYCYTNLDGFYLNPSYSEPDPNNIYNIPDEIYLQIKEDLIGEGESTNPYGISDTLYQRIQDDTANEIYMATQEVETYE